MLNSACVLCQHAIAILFGSTKAKELSHALFTIDMMSVGYIPDEYM